MRMMTRSEKEEIEEEKGERRRQKPGKKSATILPSARELTAVAGAVSVSAATLGTGEVPVLAAALDTASLELQTPI